MPKAHPAAEWAVALGRAGAFLGSRQTVLFHLPLTCCLGHNQAFLCLQLLTRGLSPNSPRDYVSWFLMVFPIVVHLGSLSWLIWEMAASP